MVVVCVRVCTMQRVLTVRQEMELFPIGIGMDQVEEALAIQQQQKTRPLPLT